MSRHARILIVDDETRICDSLGSLLSSHGYETRSAFSGAQAAELIDSHRFDIALLDHMLPDMLGHELIQKMLENNRYSQAIIMTGNASIDSAVTALRKGAYDYLRKPFEIAELIKTVQNALSHMELQQQNDEIKKKLTASQRHFQYLVDHSPDIIYTLDPGGCFTFVNHSMETLVGLRSDLIMGRHYSTIVGKNNADKSRWILNERRTGSRANQWNELRLLKFDSKGTPKKNKLFAELQSTGMYKQRKPNAPAIYLGTHGVIRDITARKLSEIKSRRIKRRLLRAEKMEAVGTLASGVAHDLNNVLSGILGYPDLILMDMPKQDPNREYIRQIQKSGEKAAVIVNDLLTLGRRGVDALEAVNMDEIVQDYFTSPEYAALTQRHPDISFTIDMKARELNILGSPVHLSKCLMNLISNAAEAMPDGGRICVTTHGCVIKKSEQPDTGIKKGRYVKLIVSDSGIGISSADLKKIFDPFYTKKKMGTSGSGLGMTIVWTTVKDHKGFINVKSSSGEGTTFNLYFPVTQKLNRRKKQYDPISIRGHGEKILVVDDMPEQRHLASNMLTALGYDVDCASTGEDAVDYITVNDTDLILLDMVLESRFDGFETFKAIKKLKPRLPVIIVSGLSKMEKITRTLELGARQHIKKPYSLKTIGLAIRKEFS